MPDIQKISVALTAEQIGALKAAVDTGEYATTSEIVREALRGEELKQLRALWRAGKASVASTPLDLGKIREQARQKLKKAAARIA